MFDENERVGKYTTDSRKKKERDTYRASRMEMGIDKSEDNTTALFAQRRKKKASERANERRVANMKKDYLC